MHNQQLTLASQGASVCIHNTKGKPKCLIHTKQ
jgi:hypothetical protein